MGLWCPGGLGRHGMLLLIRIVESHYASSFATVVSLAHQLEPFAVGEQIDAMQPLAERRIGVGLTPVGHGTVQRGLDRLLALGERALLGLALDRVELCTHLVEIVPDLGTSPAARSTNQILAIGIA